MAIFVSSLAFCAVVLLSFVTPLVATPFSHTLNDLVAKRQSPAAPAVLTDFQVYEPVLTPTGPRDQYGCVYTKLLMQHSFANSYGAPFVGNYTPPPCSFNRVNMNLTVTAEGVQYDRLALMYLGNVEVFRTSTAEPSPGVLLTWTYVKEMQQYNALWRTDQTIIFDLGNIVNSQYTSPYNITLTATFFTVPESPPTADEILPISSLSAASGQGSAFSVPSANASISYTLPRNIERAVISISANGQIGEEFWYTNVLSSDVATFANTTGGLYGYSPWREVQLLIDGQLAGVSWPFPVIFTGGIVPGFWRPIVGIDTFDLRQHEIDVTPWLPLLCDGNSHTFQIMVAGLNDDGAGHATVTENIGSYWVLTGTIFLFLDEPGHVTTGSCPVVNEPYPQIAVSSSITQDAAGQNETLTYRTAVSRQLNIQSTVRTSSGRRRASWQQTLRFANQGYLAQYGLYQVNNQTTTGADFSSSGYENTYSYPINVLSSYSIDAAGDLGINGTVNHGLDFNVYGPSVFPSGIQTFNVTSPAIFNDPGDRRGSHHFTPSDGLPVFSGALLSTTQNAVAEYYASRSGNGSYSFGTTEQDFSFAGVEEDRSATTYELYHRHVEAVNSTVTQDQQTLLDHTFTIPTGRPGPARNFRVQDARGARGRLGRGPGGPS